MNLLIKRNAKRIFLVCRRCLCRELLSSYAKHLWKELNITLDITEEDTKALKEGAVDFFEFSYYFSNCVTTHIDGQKQQKLKFHGKEKPIFKRIRLGMGN